MIVYLWAQQPGYAAWFLLSVGAAAAVLLCAVALVATRPNAARGLLLAFLRAGESVALFSVTHLAGLRRAALDTGPIAPYFETTGGLCRLSEATREALTTECAAPARLLRREPFFDGWQASVNDASVPSTHAPPIFQAVDLPSGTTRVRFRYLPPYAAASTAAFALGLLLLAVGIAINRRRALVRAPAPDAPSAPPL